MKTEILKNTVGNRRGGGYVLTCAVILAVSMIFSAVLFYARTKSAVESAMEEAGRVLDSFVMKNSVYSYGSIKQGTDYTESFDGEAFSRALAEEMNLSPGEDGLRAGDGDGNTVFVISVPEVSFARDKTLSMTASFGMRMPVYFAGRNLFWFTVPLTVKSSLESRY